jgi:hypothetical protein
MEFNWRKKTYGGDKAPKTAGLGNKVSELSDAAPNADLQTKSWNGVMGGYLFERT